MLKKGAVTDRRSNKWLTTSATAAGATAIASVGQDYELRDWSEKFGVSKEELKEAVQAVGNEASKVEQHLRERGRSNGSKPAGERS